MEEQNLKILQLNINGLAHKKSELELYLNMECYNIAILCETHKTTNKTINIKNFKHIIKDRVDGSSWGGVALLWKEHIIINEIIVPIFEEIEVIGLYIPKNDLNIISVYIPPGRNTDTIKRDLDTFFDFIANLPKVLIGGDFNGHNLFWGSNDNNVYGDLIIERVLNSHCSIINNGSFTRINPENPTNNSAIDLSLISVPLLNICNWNTEEEDLGSDHLCITIKITYNNKKEKLLKKITNVNNSIMQFNNISSVNFENMETMVDEINKHIKSNTKIINSKYTPKPWWNSNIKDLKDKKLLALKNFNQNPTTENLIKYKKARAIVKKEIIKSKRKSWNEFLENLNPSTPISKVWKCIANLEGKFNNKKIYNIINNLEDAKKFMEKFYSDDNVLEPLVYNNLLSETNDKLIDSNTFTHIIKNKKKYSSPGIDGVSYDILNKLNNDHKKNIIKFMNEIWERNEVPAALKTIKIIPIQKPNKPAIIDNLRPISLLPVILKIMNSVIKERLLYILEQHNYIPETSFGFRKGLSTMDCINLMVNTAYAAKRKKMVTAVIFFDITSAFDNVNLQILLEILGSAPIPERLKNWIYNSLINRKTIFQFGKDKLEFNVCKGLPQGDVLSPDLFNIYTKKIHEINNDNVQIMQYADDIALIAKAHSKTDLNIILQNSTNKLIELLKSIKLEVNPSKTVLMMLFKNEDNNFNVTINDINISKTNIHCWLGVYIDKALKFGRNIREVNQKARKKLELLKKIAGTSWGGHPDTITVLYKGYFRGQLDYGNYVFATACKTNMKILEVTNRQALRKIGGFTKSTPRNALHGILSEPPLDIRWNFLASKYSLKCKKNGNIVYKQNLKNLGREIEMIKNGRYIEFNKDNIKINNDHNSSTIKKYNYSNDEFTFLSLLEKNTEEIECVKQKLYDSWEGSFRNPPHIVEKITNLPKKRECSIAELRSITLAEISKYDSSRCIYTDASKKSGSCSIGVVINKYEIQFAYKLENSVSITSAEIEAIGKALSLAKLLGINDPIILTDSLNSCLIIDKYKHMIAQEPNMMKLIELGFELNATIQWIPSHINISGNDLADKAAKTALESDLVFETINNPFRFSDIVKQLKNKSAVNFQNWYNIESTNVGKLTYEILPTIYTHPWYHRKDCNVKIIKTVNRILSNHAFTNKFLFLMKLRNDDLCEECNVLDDVNHVLFKCLKYNNQRIILQISDIDDITTLRNRVGFTEMTEKLIKFMKLTNIDI
jgi:ribonuclease HI